MLRRFILFFLFMVLGAGCTAPNTNYREEVYFSLVGNKLEYNLTTTKLDSQSISADSFLIGYNDDELYVGLLDKSFQVIQYNLKDSSYKVIYDNINSVTVSFVSLIGESVYLGETYFRENSIEFELKKFKKMENLILL